MTSEQIDALWDYSKPAESCERFRAALDEAPESADEVRTQICRALGLQRKFDEGWQELANIRTKTPIVMVRVALESGRLKNSSGDKAAAIPFFHDALKTAQEHRFDFYAVDAAHMLGIATSGKESLDWNEKAIQMALASPDKRAQSWAGSLLNNTAWTYHDMKAYDRALDMFQRALDFHVNAGNEQRIRIARWSVARCLRSLERYDEALAIQTELTKWPEQGYVSEELGELLLATGRAEESKAHFKKAFELLSKDIWLKANENDRLDRLQRLGG